MSDLFAVYKLSNDGLTLLMEQVLAGDTLHVSKAHAFLATGRSQLESDLPAWRESLRWETETERRYDEAKQSRDEAAQEFRGSVRPARQWVIGAFPRGDKRPGEYGLDTLPPKSIGKMLARGRFLLQANTQEPPLEPTLPERLLAPIQQAFVQLEARVTEFQSAVANRKQARAARKTLRKEMEQRLRQLRQHLYTYFDPDDPILADYGL